MRSPRGRAATVALAAAAALTLAGAVASGDAPRGEPPAAAWRGLVGEPSVEAVLGQRVIVVLRLPSLADRVASAGGRATELQERQWTRAARAQQDLFVSRMNVQRARIHREHTFLRVLNGFSAALDPGSIALLERATEVQGVYPVRAAVPAAFDDSPLAGSPFGPGSGRRPEAGLSGYDGRGVTVALLDTGVDRRHPYISGRIEDGIDILGGGEVAVARPKPDDAAELERHGTQLAGILVGVAGPGGLRGVAPSASVLPIRVGGWQRDVRGRWTVYSRTDLLLAGLERAVDPDGDGDAHDAARIALVGMVEPFGAFAGGPLARAARGATLLDTLVVVPAGNDGPLGPAFGSVAAPGGAPDALTVGAADLRAEHERVRVVVRAGLRVVFGDVVTLAGAVVPGRSLTLAPGTARSPAATALADFFDGRGFSRVAGRVALISAGDGTREALDAAARAGAAAALVYGTRLPAGGLGLDERVRIPVVAVPWVVGREVLAQLRRGSDVGISLAPAAPSTARSTRRIAPFSSRGLAFDGRVKPDVVAAGVEIATSEPGLRGSAQFGTINGTSASAAIVAGAAALLAEARPELGAAGLRGALVGSAVPLKGVPLTGQGAGLVDLERAVRAEVAVAPASFGFPRATHARWRAARLVTVRNLSRRRLRIGVGIDEYGVPAAATSLIARPRGLRLAPGATAVVRVAARVPLPTAGGPPAEAALVLHPQAGAPVRVPFAVAFARRLPGLIGAARLVPRTFTPSTAEPAVLSIEAGCAATRACRGEVQALARLDVELWTGDGKRMGALALLRNLLPGRYVFAITGRDPGGGALADGHYALRLVATPTGGGRPSVRIVQFDVK